MGVTEVNGSHAHLFKTSDLAVFARQHDATQLAAHIVLCLDKAPAIHFAIAELDCKRIDEMKQQNKRKSTAHERNIICTSERLYLEVKRRTKSLFGEKCGGSISPVTMCPSASCSSLIGKPMLPIASNHKLSRQPIYCSNFGFRKYMRAYLQPSRCNRKHSGAQ
jgi:hypothetical protein